VTPMRLALEGITAIDVSQIAAVPMAARHLADFGARVIHVEHPVRGDAWRGFQAAQGLSDVPYLWEHFNRNKRSLALDISTPQGQQVLYHMVERSDVFFTNLRLWERDKYHLGYEDLKACNPRLIYGSLTAFGKKGPDRNNPAYDATSYWSRSGLQYLLTTPGMSAPAFRGAFGDNVTGLGLALGVMIALYDRERTGVGQEIDVSLLQMGLYQMTFDIGGVLASGGQFEKKRFSRYQETEDMKAERERLMEEAKGPLARLQEYYRRNAPNPLAVPYETRDGRTISFVAVHADRNWPLVCRLIGREDLASEERFQTIEGRKEHKSELYDILKEAFAARTLADWRESLRGIPCAVVQTADEAINDPQARANDFFVKLEHPTYGSMEVMASPINMSETPSTLEMPAPEFGQHTEEVLLEFGYSWEGIAALKAANVIA